MTGLIDVGGGMRGIYGAGVLDCFLENGLRFDYCAGVSAGSANVASFLANQKGRNLRFFTIHSLDKRYMSFGNWLKTRSYFGLDFIYQTLTDELDPIDYDKLLSTTSVLRVVATDAETGRPHYFGLADFQKNNSEVLKASCAIPALNRPVEIKGKLYFDGGVSDPVPVKKAVADGCDKLTVILTKPIDYIKSPEKLRRVYPVFLKEYPHIVEALDSRHEVYMDSVRYLKALEKAGKAVIVSPSRSLRISTATRNIETLKAFYDLGFQDAQSRIKSGKI